MVLVSASVFEVRDVTNVKKKALLAFSTDREAAQRARDCPGHANSTSDASRAEYHRMMNVYQL